MSLPEKENAAQVSKKKTSLANAKKRIYAFCAYQERCVSEVISKLEEFQLTQNQIDPIVAELVKEGYIDDKRFAEAFVSGRFNIKKWGKVRIRQELKMRDIPDHHITYALDQIDEGVYLSVLKNLAERKWTLTNELHIPRKKAKVQRFLMFRGFESDLIRDVVDEITP